MKPQAKTLRRAECIAPLIRSIAGEVKERLLAMRQLDASLKELSAHRREPVNEIRLVEAELYLHRRELERVQKELAHLGCHLDPEHPERIVCSADGGQWIYEEHLDKTGYRPERPGLKA
jgi:hypothetical protein